MSLDGRKHVSAVEKWQAPVKLAGVWSGEIVERAIGWVLLLRRWLPSSRPAPIKTKHGQAGAALSIPGAAEVLGQRQGIFG